jgi:hypothetical protein
MRALLVLLVLANLGFIALSRGWLEPFVGLSTQHEREPQRLAAQLNAQSVRVLDPNAAGSALATATAIDAPLCLQAGPFTAEQIDAAQAWLQQAQIPATAWSRTRTETPGQWQVVLGPFTAPDALRRRRDALQRQGFEVEEVGTASGEPSALSFGRFDDPAAAEAALSRLRQRGLSGASVVTLSAPSTQHWLRVAQADGALRERLAQLPQAAAGAGFVSCARAP